jgi:hypothetical protein
MSTPLIYYTKKEINVKTSFLKNIHLPSFFITLLPLVNNEYSPPLKPQSHHH